MRIVLETTLLIALSIALFVGGMQFIKIPATVEVAMPFYAVDAEESPYASAEAWLIFDLTTGETILGKNEHVPLPIASVTKLMTAKVAYTTLDLATSTVVTERAQATEGEAGRLEAGEVIGVRELLVPLLLESSNDAAEALVEAGGGETFISNMNANARMLGMNHTAYQDASGLSPGNVSSAGDLSRLVRSIARDDPYLLDVTSLKQYVGTHHDWLNNNPVVKEAGYRGGKHGYIPESKKTFAGVFDQTFKEGVTRRVGVILLKSDDVADDVANLRAYTSAHVAYGQQF